MALGRKAMTVLVVILMVCATFLLVAALSFHSYQKDFHTNGGSSTYEFELFKPASSSINAIILIDNFGPFPAMIHFQNGTSMNVSNEITTFHIHMGTDSNGYSQYLYGQSGASLSYLHPFNARITNVDQQINSSYPPQDNNVYAFYVSSELGVSISVYVVGEYL